MVILGGAPVGFLMSVYLSPEVVVRFRFWPRSLVGASSGDDGLAGASGGDDGRPNDGDRDGLALWWSS
jgi:hypothetical protein